MAETEVQPRQKASAFDWWSSIPAPVRGVAAGAGVYFIYKWWKKEQDEKESEDEKKEISETEKELKEAEKTVPASYSPSQFKSWANSLEDYMFDAGTDKTGIIEIMKKLKTQTDFLALKAAFGKRIYYTFGFSYGYKTLGQWLAIEDSWLEDLVADVNAVLKKKGITGRF